MKLLFIDPLTLACVGMQEFVKTMDGVKLVGATSDKTAALNLANTHQPDIIMIDSNLPDFLGFTLAKKLCEVSPQSKLIFNLGYPVRLFVAFLCDFNCQSIITHNTRCREYTKIFQNVMEDHIYYDRNIQCIMDDIHVRHYLTANEQHVKATLNIEELELLVYYSSHPYFQEANLNIKTILSEQEVSNSTQSLYQKFNVRSKEELKDIFKTMILGTTIEHLYL